MAAHHEVHLETYIVNKLVKNGWVEGHPDQYDPVRALYSEDVVSWIKASQPQVWDKLTRLNGEDAEKALLDRLEKALTVKSGGTMNVIRQGFEMAGCGNIAMSQAAPEDERNNKEVEKYKNNILRVVRQLKYCPTREWAIDLGFFINGIPVATVELKTDFTQAIEDAIRQYKSDRLPIDPKTKRKEPLLTFKRGAVVHFAMSDSEIAMCTELKGDGSFFLPFNKGNDGHAGNKPREDGEYPVAYFWEEICTRDSWLRIFHSFVYVETKEKVDKLGMPYKAETLIFPRYHQFDAVNKMIADARVLGPGQQYLCEHSAGSGKTSTIAWTAHDLIKLRYPDGKAYFNSVIIVTDRTVLDAQLQDAVKQLDHQFGVIETISENLRGGKSKSNRLADALKKGVPIIVVTIQTFPYAMEAIITEQSLKDRNFAVIIDEAHTSQTGSTAQGLRAALSLDSKVQLDQMSLEDMLLEIQKSRVRPKNISHFAFTATPKHSTFTLFGRPANPNMPASDDNKPVSFHRYTQRQAIEEGFILDVLKNYVPYEQAVRLGDDGINDKRVDKKFARRALASWKTLHPTIVSNKVEFILDHFSQNIAGLLNGEAKAMVVTSGRPQAVKYKLAFDKFIKRNKLEHIKALVAFSGKVEGKLLGDDDEKDSLGIDVDKEYSEYNLNTTASGDLRNEFERAEYRVMIVANKFQTGFNQPKLVAMYIDKKISGVEAVQTLSRLNRTYPGKDETYVIDFVNDPKTIVDAFKQYDDGAEIESVQDLNVIYDMKNILDNAGIYIAEDLEAFKQARGRSVLGKEADSSLHKKLYSATQRPTDVFNSKLKILTDAIESWDAAIDKAVSLNDKKAQEFAEIQRSEYATEREGLMRFKTNLSRFVRVYNYVAQLVELGDAELENFAAFTKLYSKRLKGISPEQIDLRGLALMNYQIRPISDSGYEGVKAELKPIAANESDPSDREKDFITQIIARINDLFGNLSDDVGRNHFTSHIVEIAKKDVNVVDQVNNNTKAQALQGDLPGVVRGATVEAMKSHSELARSLLKDPQNMTTFFGLIYDILKHSNSSRGGIIVSGGVHQQSPSIGVKNIDIGWDRSEIYAGADIKFIESVEFDDELLRDPRNIPIWFGTNRQLILNEGNATFGKWSSSTTLGKCIVNVPLGHKPGSIGSSWWIRLVKGDDRLKVLSVQPMKDELYWQELKSAMQEDRAPDKNEALFFLHGYNVTFEDAAIRTAQLSYDLKISPAIFYSWPSDGEISSYNADEATIEASYDAIIEFVEKLDLAAIESGATLHVMAHSMGNRAILKALEAISIGVSGGSNSAIDKLVFAAPDVDARVFMQAMQKIETLKSYKTLYVSQKDKAVWLSKSLHKNDRAGLMPPVTIVDGVDTIDSTGVDETFLGHSYIVSVRALLTDLSGLIKASLKPKDRVGLEKLSSDDGKEYWRIL